MPIQGEDMARIRLARAEEEASKNEHRLHERISELERKNALLAAESKSNYERGVQQATAVYTEVIREYVAENVKLRDFARRLYAFAYDEYPDGTELNFGDEARELEIEVSDG